MLIPVLIYALSDVALLAVGAVLVAALLRVVAEPFDRYTPLPILAGLTLANLILGTLLGFTVDVFGSEMAHEFSDVTRRITTSAHDLRGRLAESEIGEYVLGRVSGTRFSVTAALRDLFSAGTSLAAALVVSLISAIYLTAQPGLYRRGIVLLFAERHQRRVDGGLVAVGKGLRLWLIGQLVEMLILALLSLLAAWLIGLPSIYALALIALVAEFVPYLGPILAAVPAVLMALTKGDRAAVLTAIAYLLIRDPGH